MKATLHRTVSLLALFAVLVLAAGCGSQNAGTDGSSAPSQESPEAKLTQQKCTMCHTFDRVEQAKRDRAGWEETVNRMQSNGLVVTDEEKRQIVDYLAATYGQ